VQWPQKIDKNILKDIQIYKNHLLNTYVKEILQINVAYNSILIIYTSTIDNVYDKYLALKAQYSNRVRLNKCAFRHWKIPVCYDEKFGIDLEEISIKNKLSKSEIIRLHSDAIYPVFFIGFLPGFLYLGGLDNRLHFPRKKQPRLHVKKGAVAIGNHQTGIYPNSSPAGWNIIGNSPINFFDASSSLPCFAKPGDSIQFIPITIEMHENISEAVKNGTYNLKSEPIND